MPDVFIGLKEAAEFEGVKYNTLVQRIKRSPNQYKTRTQPRENGGREQVLVSVDSLTAKGRKAWRAAPFNHAVLKRFVHICFIFLSLCSLWAFNEKVLSYFAPNLSQMYLTPIEL